MIDFAECVNKGLLRKVPPSKEKARLSIEKAEHLLFEAEENLKEGRIDSAVIVAYLSIFHAGRAVLFKDGFREKSHECIIRYIEEKCSEIESESVEKLEKYKSERNKVQYDITYSPTENQAEEMITFAKSFIEEIDEII